MKRYEKEAFAKTFGIFFISLAFLSTLLAYFYHSEQKYNLNDQIFAQMKEFTYDFKKYPFRVDVLPHSRDVDFLNIQPCVEGVCGYFAIESSQKSMFKIILDSEDYTRESNALLLRVLLVYALVLCAIFVFSLFYSFYALRPLKKALVLLEDFLKDVIHDLNTPVTSLLLNTRALAKKAPSEELERIELGAKTIASLYHNLEVLHKEFIPKKHHVNLAKLLHTRAKTFQLLYPKMIFVFKTNSCVVESDEDSVGRIFDNILSNACKYSKKNGTITIHNSSNIVTIEDSGVGIKRCDLVFNRYYKENERGLGLGLNIVKTLCDALGIGIEIKSQLGEGTQVRLNFPLEEKQ